MKLCSLFIHSIIEQTFTESCLCGRTDRVGYTAVDKTAGAPFPMAGQARERLKELHEIIQNLFNDSYVQSREGKVALCELRSLGKNDVCKSQQRLPGGFLTVR